MNTFKAIVSNGNFWTALIGVVSAIMAACGLPAGSITQIASIITAASVLIAAVVGESIKQTVAFKVNAQKEIEIAKISAGK